MKQSELCKALGLSKGQVSKLVSRGMPTETVESAEAWRRKKLEPMMVVAHQVKKVRAGMLSENDPANPLANPIDAILFGVLPQLLFDRAALLTVLTDEGIHPTQEQFECIAANLAGRLWFVLVHELGFPEHDLNLPDWMNETE